MLEHLPINLLVASAEAVISPLLIIVLCAVAAIGTVLVLPRRTEGATRKIGGTIIAVVGVILGATLIRVSVGRHDPMGVYFWIFSAVAVFASLRVITHRRPVYSALYFVLTVFASAGLFVLLWAEFMAAALILIYAGAILVTYVFVIMLAARSGAGGEFDDCDQVSREPVAAAMIGFGLLALLLYVIFDRAPASGDLPAAAIASDLTVRGLAQYLFRHQLVNLELAGVLLTMAMVGAIIIARRRLWTSRPATDAAARAVEIGDDDPHSVPVTGTGDPRQKAYPET